MSESVAPTPVRVRLPPHLRALAEVEGEVTLEVDGPPTVRGVLDAIEARFPVLEGTIRDRETGERRPLVRYFACGKDLSLEPQDTPLPVAVVEGEDVFQVVGSIAGG